MADGDSEVTFNPGATEKPCMSEISQDMSLGLEARISEEARGLVIATGSPQQRGK